MNNPRDNIAANLCHLRKINRMSQEEVAEKNRRKSPGCGQMGKG